MKRIQEDSKNSLMNSWFVSSGLSNFQNGTKDAQAEAEDQLAQFVHHFGIEQSEDLSKALAEHPQAAKEDIEALWSEMEAAKISAVTVAGSASESGEPSIGLTPLTAAVFTFVPGAATRIGAETA